MGFKLTGWASPAEEHAVHRALSLDELLIPKPSATVFLRCDSDDFRRVGIHKGDLLIVERGRTAKHRDLVVGVIEGEFRLGWYNRERYTLVTGDEEIPLEQPEAFAIEGCVTSSIRLWQTPTELAGSNGRCSG